jgi:hypothetical protein
MRRRRDANLHAAAANLNDVHHNVVGNHNRLAALAGKHEHGRLLSFNVGSRSPRRC